MTPQKYTYRVVLLLCCLYTSSVVKGQGTCSSSALAPVFLQTFGQGANSSSKTTVPSGFTTNYSFQSSGALDDGRYIVTPRVQNAGRNDWAVGSDHTGNSNGNMFLVNAGTGGSVFFTQQVNNLCPGSTYNFSAWLANVNTTSNTLPICGSGYVYPNVTFNIKNTSGTILATYNTGNLPLTANRSVAPNWQQYGFSFALPAGTTSLILEMVDAYGGQPQCGNDLAIDDILFTACTPTATISFSNGTTVCAGTSTTINAAIVNNPFTSPAYQWQKSTDGGTTWSNIGTAGSSSSYTINSVTSTDGAAYRVIVGPDVASLSSSTCITASAAVSLTVASVKLNDDVIECNNGITSYSASDAYYKVTYSNTNAGNSYLWSVSSSGSWSFQGSHSPSSQYPRFQFNSSAAYTVSVQFTTNGVSCSDTQVVFKNAVALASILNSKDTSICYNTNSVALSGSISYVTNNYTWSTSGTGTFSNANSLNPTYTPSLADKQSGLVKLYFTGTSTYNATGNCGSNTSKDSMILRIYPNNTGTNTSTAICSNQLLTHTPSSTQPGSTFLWTSVFTSGSGSGNTASGSGNISNLLVNASSTTAAVVTYTITPYYAGCAGAPYTLTVTVNPNPTLTITNTTTEICSGVATNIQLSSSLAGSLFSWTSSIVSGTASGHSSNATASSVNTITDIITNTSTANAIVRYRITAVSPNGCIGIDSTDITIKPNPTIAAAGTDLQLCNLSSTQLSANTPIVGNGTWTMASGPSTVTFSNASLATSSVSGLVPGTYVFVWSIANSPCAVSRDSVNVIISPETVAGTLTSNMNVCFGSNSGTLTLTGYTGNIIRWEASTDGGTNWTSIANTSNTHSFNNLTASTIFRAVVQSGTCSSQFSNTVTVTVDPLTVPGTLSGTTTVCSGSNSGVLTLSGYTGNIIRWEASTDGGLSWPTSYAVNTNTYTFSNLTQTTTFRAVVQSGSCTVEYSNAITITVSPLTIPGILGNDATVCATANNGLLTLNGNNGTILNWEFSVNNGSSWSVISNTSNTQSYTDLTSTTQYRVSVQSGVCAPQYSNTTTITVVPPVETPNAGNDFGVCNVAATTLNATAPSSGSGSWLLISGPSTVSFTNTADAHTTVNGLVAGTYQFEWTISNGVCTNLKDTVIVTVYPATVPGTLSASATVCATENNGTLALTGFTGNILYWEASTDNGTSWTNIPNTTNTLNFTNLSSTTQYRVSVQSGVCAPQYSNIITVTVLPAVTTANAGTDTHVCFTTATTLAANTPTNGTGTWSVLPGAPSAVTFTNANNPNSTVNGLVVGTYQFVWTISNGTCTDSKDTITITVDPQTVPGTLSASTTVCATANSGTLSLAGFTGNILHWEASTDNGTSWTNIPNTTNTLNFTNLSSTTQYRVSVQSGVCASQYSNIITVTVMPAVTTANAGTDTHVCFTTATTLAANTPTNGTGTWSVLPGAPSAVTFTNANNPNSTVNGLVVGTYQFVWTISNGTCTDSKDTVTITVDPQTVPGTLSASATVCATENNGTLALTGFTGNILHWEASTDNGTSWTNIPSTTNTINFTNLSSTTQYRVSVQSGVCAPQYSNIITVTVLPAVTTANAGADQSICNVTGITLNGNNPTSGAGTWSVLPGAPSTVTFTNAASHNTTVTGMVAGTYQFVWTISNGTCTDSKDTVQVVIHPPSVPGNITAEATVCAIANNGTLTLIGNTGNVIRWESSTNYGASWTTLSNTTNTLDYNNLSSTTTFRAAVQNQNCPALYTNLNTITVLQPVTPANAGPDTTFINGVSSYTLNGNMPSSGTGVWSVVPGATSPLNFSGITNPKATITGLDYVHGTPPTDGKYLLVWTISNGYCPVSTDTMQITVQPPTNPGVIGPDAVVCTGNNSGTLQLTDYLGTILHWELSVNNGVTWNVISSTIGTNQDTYTYNNLTQTTLFRALVKNGVGAELYSGIAATVTVLELVTPANAGPDQFLCNTTSTTLAGNSPTSGMGTWSALPGNPTATSFSNAADPNSVVSGLSYGTYQFAWTISNGICSDSEDIVTITIQQPTVAGSISADNTVCITSNNGTLQLTGFFGSIVQTEYSTDNGITWAGITNTANQSTISYTNLTQTTQFRSQIKNGVCPALVTNIVTVTVLPEVTPADAGADQVLCNTTAATLNANNPTSGTGIWTVLPGAPSTVSFTNAADPATTVNGLTYGTYRFVWTISNTLCASSSDIVEIRIVPPTIAGNLVASATVCATNNTDILTLSGNNGSIIRWEYSTNNGGSWNNISNTTNTYTYNNLNTTTTYRALNQNEICPALYSNDVTITVIPPVTPANAGTDQVLCNVTSVTLNGNTPTSGTGTWTLAAGAPSSVTFTNANDPNTTVNGLVAGTYQFIWTIGNGMCDPSTDMVEIRIVPPTIAGNLVASATVCATNNTDILTLSGNNGSIIRWEYSTNNGGSWNNISNTTNTYTYNNLNTTTTYRALNQNEICPALYSNDVTITVIPPVTPANAGTDQVLCNVTSVTLNGNTPTSGTGTWTLAAGAPSSVTFTNANDPNTTVNGLVAGTYQFIWTIGNGMCDPSTDMVSVRIDPLTIPGSLVADATVCATANSNILSLSGYTGDILRWEFTTPGNASWTTITNITNTLTYTNLNTTTTYRVVVQSGSCNPQYSNDVTITVLQPVTPANAGADQLLCNAVTTVLEGNQPVSGTGVWTHVSGPTVPVFANATDPRTAVNGLAVGTYVFVWTITNNLCIDSKDTVQITITPVTVPGVLSSNATVCSGVNNGSLELSGTTGSVLHWEYSTDNGISWTVLANTSNTYTYTNLTASTLFRVLVQNSVCATAYSNPVQITVMPQVTPAVAGLNQALCNSSTGRLEGNTPSSGVGMWSQTAGPTTAIFANAGLAATNISGLSTGTYRFAWTISNAVCPSSSNEVEIRIDPSTSAGILSGNDTVCTNINTGTLSIANYTGTIIRWESSVDNGTNWSPINTTQNTYSYTNLTATTRFRVLVQSGVCASLYSNTVTITVNPLTVGGHIAANDTVCVTSNNGTLQLTNYVGDLIRWESSIDNGNNWTLINYTGDQYSFSNLLSTTLFRVMVQSGVCSAAFSDTVNIVVDAATVAGTLSGADTVCYNNNSGQVILSGKLGSVIQWESSENSGAIWSPINTALTDTIRYNNLQRTTLYRSLVKNGTCAVMYTTPVEIAVVEPVTIANAGNDILVCNAASFTTLRANTALSGTGMWRQIAGPNNVSFADATNPNTTVSGLVPGTYEFAWEISNGICVSSSDTVSVKVDQTIADFTLSGANNCGNTVYQFNDRSRSNFGIAEWKWSIAPGDTVYQKENSIRFTSEGTYTMNLSVVSNLGCVNTLQAQFLVNVFEFPQVDIDAIRDVCKGQLTQLAPIVNSKDTIAMLLWNLGNGTRSTDSLIAVRYLIDGQYTVRLTATTVNNCFDSAYKAMTVHPLPVINITPNSTICKGDSIRLIASGARHYIWFDQLNNITATGTDANIVRPTGTTTVRVIGYDEHGCSEIKSTSIRVIQPLKMFAAQGDTLCIGESKQLIATGASSYRWYPETGLNNTQVANPVARPVETTVYNVIGKDAYNCFTDTAQIKVVVGRPTPINIGRDTIITAGTSLQLRVLSTNAINGGNDQIKKWRWGGDVSISCPTCPTPEVKLSNDACISCTVVNNYGCVSTDTICIKTLCPATELFVPNAFSPDGDGINDVLLVQGKGIKLIKSFRIYNRWGQLVFEKANFSPGDPAYAWNGTAFGKAVTPDVFVYVSEVICEKGLPTIFKGNITILK